jgi:tRNA 2-thiouridine synthesizing protein E
MAYECDGATIETDEEGYITDISLWSQELAILIAKEERIDMGDDHWEVVNFLRNYYEEYQIAPAVRVLTKAIKRTLGADKGNSPNRRVVFNDRLRPWYLAPSMQYWLTSLWRFSSLACCTGAGSTPERLRH